MKVIILILFVLLAATFVVDYFRKKAGQTPPQAERLPTANEASPTETGRMRVAHIVEAIKKGETDKQSDPQPPKPSSLSDESDTSLPDPFDGKTPK